VTRGLNEPRSISLLCRGIVILAIGYRWRSRETELKLHVYSCGMSNSISNVLSLSYTPSWRGPDKNLAISFFDAVRGDFSILSSSIRR